MLNCHRVLSRLSKITRQVNAGYIDQQSEKFIGRICTRNASDKKTVKSDLKPASGTTLKAEDCIPPKYEKISSIEEPSSTTACDIPTAQYNSCPPDCEINCGKIPPNGPKDDTIFENYWKHILAALALTGVGFYALTRDDKNKKTTESSDKSVKQKSIIKNESYKKKQGEKIRYPITSLSIPPEIPYLLIGGGTAAFSAFRSIKSHDPKAKVLVITDESDNPYMRPPLSKELWYNKDMKLATELNFKQWNGTQRSLYYEPPEFYTKVESLMSSDKGGVAVATGWKIERIDPLKKIAILDDGYEIKYDKCLIATGASPKNLAIFETADDEIKSKVIAFRTKDNFLDLENRLNDPNINNIVIIGGGFLGSELACSIARNFENTKKKIYQIYKEKYIMSQILPEYLSKWATEKTTMEGVTCIANSEIKDIEINSGNMNLILNDGKKINADQVIIAVGVDANTELAKTSNLEVDKNIGGFLVNAELEARSNLWVAGDAACFYDVKLGRRRVEHHDHAVISGRLAGENMTGAGKPYLHQSMFWSDLGPEVGYEAIGIVDSLLPTVGVFAKLDDKNNKSSETKNKHLNNDNELSNKNTKKSDKSELLSHTIDNNNSDNNNGQKKNRDCSDNITKPIQNKDDYEKGVIFYLRDDIVVGIVLWNIFNRMSIARQVLARGTKYDEINEVAKLFTIHED
ncbi:hypothetical protein HCN44_005993 [Aphidius gifuensis]|uniref:Apoptosis-inducing factor 1, mitochondrial n=1 Tax=Aphidius gifuensis TaxID=684658 RepID=A0A834Y438_APHGI|nr:apoptosis-inducing factor 1, mitochondrial [Aphidius gifuensis]KAF7997422.1 hypothetical protein HCN44_005993 [Aphidius gifuensis]